MKLGFLCSWERESKERENGDGVCLVEADSTPFVSLSTNIHVSLYVYTFFSLFLNFFFFFLGLYVGLCGAMVSTVKQVDFEQPKYALDLEITQYKFKNNYKKSKIKTNLIRKK